MTNRELRDAVATQPFLPFRIRMLDGREFDVKHPEFIHVTQGVRNFVFVDYAKKSHRILDLLHVQELEYPLYDDPNEEPVTEAA